MGPRDFRRGVGLSRSVFCCAWPTVQKAAGTGLALRDEDEYHKGVLI